MPTSRRDPRRPSRGFTLIELLIVIAILAITFLVTVQFSRNLAPESALGSAARDLSSTIEEARGAAIVCGRRVFLEVDLGENDRAAQGYRTIEEPLPGHEKDAEDDEFMLTVRTWRPLPAGVRIESLLLGEEEPSTRGIVRIALQPDGSMPSHLIRLWAPELDPERGRSSGWACVQVAGLLGTARVINRYVEPEFLREDTFQ